MIKVGKPIGKYRSSSLLVVLIIISMVLMVVTSGRYNFSLKKIGNTFFSVFQIAVNSTTGFVKNTFNSIEELRKLKDEHEGVLKLLESYQTRDRDFIELKQENLSLKKQLNFKTASEYRFESAEIVAQEPGNLFSTLIINKGTRDGILRNMPVIAYQNGFQGLVGKIVETSLFTSKVIPLFDNIAFVASRMLESRYEGLVNGEGSKNSYLIMNYVTKNAYKSLKNGDLVITSGMQSIYPKGIFIGRVRNIKIPEWQTSLVLEIEPVVDFSRLEYVLVLVGYKTNDQ